MKIKALLALFVFLLWSPPPLMSEGTMPKDSTNEVVALGTYSNMRFTREHQYGYEVALWRYNDGIIGLFLRADGLAGDTPIGMIQNVPRRRMAKPLLLGLVRPVRVGSPVRPAWGMAGRS